VKVSALGEFGLIDRLAELLATHEDAGLTGRLSVGIGDDAAVWLADGVAVIATTDTLVANVHFLPERTPWRDLGWKALAVNVSDIAAMGGTPDVALITLCLPEDAQAEQLDELYRGMAEAGAAYGVAIAGGDIVRSPVFAVSVALTGRAQLDTTGEPLVLRRGGARDGDLIAVTGTLGGSAAGLRALRDGKDDSDAVRALIERCLRPTARAQAGPAALAAGIRCAIDVSDGLLQDLGHICHASGLGATVWRDKVPVDPALSEVFDADEALRLAASGGEDYELLVTGSQEHIDAFARAVDVPLTVIGEMVIDPERRARLLDESGREIALPEAGWDHLRASS
jgi:thiamine-monophosphate kinase